jgi:hypothetical protein
MLSFPHPAITDGILPFNVILLNGVTEMQPQVSKTRKPLAVENYFAI